MAAVILGLVVQTGCSHKTDSTAGRSEIAVKATDSGCDVAQSNLPTGPVTFQITNSGTKVTDFYFYAPGDRVMGEAINIEPGSTSLLTVTLTTPGIYQTACNPSMAAGPEIRHNINVAGIANAQHVQAIDSYRDYLKAQLTGLRDAAADFVTAVRSRDITAARRHYPLARSYYERIEPVASSFPGQLDARIDRREADLMASESWTGFHRLEKDLWAQGLQPDSSHIADQLVADVNELTAGITAPTYKLDVAQIASGAVGLLDEIAKTKITGEEDIYSHTDLCDVQANVEGSRAALNTLRPIIDTRNRSLGPEIDRRFTDLTAVLARYRIGDRFVSYDTVVQPDRIALSRNIDALSAVLSQVQPLVAAP
jgi:iron uptake system component EfeO